MINSFRLSSIEISLEHITSVLQIKVANWGSHLRVVRPSPLLSLLLSYREVCLLQSLRFLSSSIFAIVKIEDNRLKPLLTPRTVVIFRNFEPGPNHEQPPGARKTWSLTGLGNYPVKRYLQRKSALPTHWLEDKIENQFGTGQLVEDVQEYKRKWHNHVVGLSRNVRHDKHRPILITLLDDGTMGLQGEDVHSTLFSIVMGQDSIIQSAEE